MPDSRPGAAHDATTVTCTNIAMYSVFDYLESVIEAFNKPQAIKRGMQRTNRDFWFVAFATQQ